MLMLFRSVACGTVECTFVRSDMCVRISSGICSRSQLLKEQMATTQINVGTKVFQHHTLALRLSRIRAQPHCQHIRHACLQRVPRHCLSYFLAQVCKHSLASVLCQLFDCPCRIDHVVVVWSCWKLLHRATDRLCCTARTRVFLINSCCLCTRGRTSTRSRYLWLRAVYMRRATLLSESLDRGCQITERLLLQPCCGFYHWCVFVRDCSLLLKEGSLERFS